MRPLIPTAMLLVYALFAVQFARAADSPAPVGLVGTWRLVSFEDVENGQTVRRFGDKPLGIFIYTADGHVAIQIANPANPVCVAPGKKSGPGRKDDSDISGGYAGSDQRRPFRLEGDRLVIGDGKTWTRVLERVR